MKIFKSRDIGIDLGTANIFVTVKGKGIILREPSVIAVENKTGEVIAIGTEAKEMLGRTPKEVKAIRPLKDGVIADFTATKLLLKKIMDKICKKYNSIRPRVIVGVPSGITEVEERAVEETIIHAGAKEVFLIEEPMAAAIGAGIQIEEPNGNIIVDIGGGTTEVAVISLGGIVVSNSLRTAGDELDEDIINYIKRELNLAIGEVTAEQIKKEIGSAMPLMSKMKRLSNRTATNRNSYIRPNRNSNERINNTNSRNNKNNTRKNSARTSIRHNGKRNCISRWRSINKKFR